MTHDLDAILAEIDELAGMREIEPGDVTIAMLSEMWNVADVTATRRMAKLVSAGQYKSLLVYDPERGRRIRVYRRCGDD